MKLFFNQLRQIRQQEKSINFLVIQSQKYCEEIEELKDSVKYKNDAIKRANDRSAYYEVKHGETIDLLNQQIEVNKTLETNNQKQAQRIKELTAETERLQFSKQQVINDFICKSNKATQGLEKANKMHDACLKVLENQTTTGMQDLAKYIAENVSVEQRKRNCGFYDNINKRYKKPQEQTHVNFKSNYPYLQRRFDNINYLFADYKLNPSDEIIDYTVLNHFSKGKPQLNNDVAIYDFIITVEKSNEMYCYKAVNTAKNKYYLTNFFNDKATAVKTLDQLIKHIESITPPMKGQ